MSWYLRASSSISQRFPIQIPFSQRQFLILPWPVDVCPRHLGLVLLIEPGVHWTSMMCSKYIETRENLAISVDVSQCEFMLLVLNMLLLLLLLLLFFFFLFFVCRHWICSLCPFEWVVSLTSTWLIMVGMWFHHRYLHKLWPLASTWKHTARHPLAMKHGPGGRPFHFEINIHKTSMTIK